MIPGTLMPGHIVNTGGTAGPTPIVTPDDWIHVPHTDYVATAPGTLTITFSVDYTNVLWIQQPIRVQDGSGVEFGDTANQISGYNHITGIDTTNVDSRGRIYFEIIDDGGMAAFHLALYKKDTYDAPNLVAHTDSYAAAGDQNLHEDNASGLGGYVHIDAALDPFFFYVEFWKWYTINTLTATTMTLFGPVLSTGAGMVQNVWYGKPTRLVTKEYTIDGWEEDGGVWIPNSFCDADSDALLVEDENTYRTWEKEYARAVRFRAQYKDGTSVATDPVVDYMINGLHLSLTSAGGHYGQSLLAAGNWYSTAAVDPATYGTERGYTLDIATSQCEGDDVPMFLSFEVVFVLE